MRDNSIAKIAEGFAAETEEERYSYAACSRDPATVRLASLLESRPPHALLIPEWVKRRLQDRVMDLYEKIPCEIVIVKPEAGEPYTTSEQMQRDVKERNIFYARHRSIGPVTGHCTQHWRIVHDYYGHALTGGGFTFSGELLAYCVHTDQFPRECLPFIWNNVVLENAYRLNRGSFYCIVKQCPSVIVFDETKFGPMEEFYL